VLGKPVFELAALAGFMSSKGEARRLAQQGGLSLNNTKADPARVVEANDLIGERMLLLRSGKKSYFLVKVEK
jgi:tyrosyl-tRNA synthetase